MEINKLNWDTEFFECEIGEVFLENSSEFSFTNAKNFDLIVVKQSEEFEIKIVGFKESFKETKINFIKSELSKNNINFPEIKDTDFSEKPMQFFQNLTYESGKYSRFLLDGKFGEAKFKNLYDEWIINSNNKKFAIKTFYLENKENATGFVTLQRKKSEGKIGLIAINPMFQGQGLGRKLLEYVENYCLENHITSLEIPTQKENREACKFYQKLGYQTKNQEIVKHFWKI